MIPYIMLAGGLVLLIVSGNYLVDSATQIARHFHLPPLIIGMTIVAFGTSAPELIVSLTAGLGGHPAIALGNVIGSNCVNSCVIVGATALICPFFVQERSIKVDAMFMLLLTAVMMGAGFLTGGIDRVAGISLFLLLSAFIWWSIKQAQTSPEGADTETKEEGTNRPLWLSIVILIVSIALLSVGADLMVDGATAIAKLLGVSERVISVTIVAIGTSLPELTASVMSAIKKQPDLTIGNIIGSNIFNIGCVLGLTTAISPIELGAAPSVTPAQFQADTLWMLAFEFMLLVGMINVTGNIEKYRKSGLATNLFSAQDGLVGRIWGACALALYAFYVYKLLS